MAPRERLAIVGVLGSGREEHAERAEPLGAWLARRGVHLLTGGGAGTMLAVSRAFHGVAERAGLVIGILPGAGAKREFAPVAGYPNPFVELPIATHLPLSGASGTSPRSRNHINILSSDVLVALPGSHGTSSEVALALLYGKPIVAFAAGRHEIPLLSDDVPLEPELAGVQAFVEQCLARR